jgi:hypothetical protein
MTALNSRTLNAPSRLELPPIGDKKEIDRQSGAGHAAFV